jgi:RNA polymerase sigma-54 factor
MQLSFSTSVGHRQTHTVSHQLRQAIVLLQMGNAELLSFIESLAEENPFVEVRMPLPTAPALPSARAGGEEDWDRIASLPDRNGLSFYGHVAAQVAGMPLAADEAVLASVFLDELEPSGWLGAPVAEVAALAGTSEDAAQRLLERLQRLDPPGVFARSLAECLRLQAQEAGILSPLFDAVLRNLPLLAAADLPGLARACGCTLAELRPILRLLRALDPKPGARFAPEPDPVRPPDLIVTRAPGGWSVELNRSTLPAVVVADPDAVVPSGRPTSAAAGGYVAERLSVARWLARAVDHRNRTVLSIGEEIVRRQHAYFALGPQHQRPLVLKDIATVVGVHESTVSRVTTGIMMATPHGTFPLKQFFTAALPTRSDEPGSAGAVRHMIARVIRAEQADRPLSDDQLVRAMQQEGVTVARRTVAKYREQMNIPSSAVRRRQSIVSGRL